MLSRILYIYVIQYECCNFKVVYHNISPVVSVDGWWYLVQVAPSYADSIPCYVQTQSRIKCFTSSLFKSKNFPQPGVIDRGWFPLKNFEKSLTLPLREDQALCKMQCLFAFLSIKISRITTTKTHRVMLRIRLSCKSTTGVVFLPVTF